MTSNEFKHLGQFVPLETKKCLILCLFVLFKRTIQKLSSAPAEKQKHTIILVLYFFQLCKSLFLHD